MAGRAVIREYRERDGAACWELRRNAFFGPFRRHLNEEQVAAGADSYDLPVFTRRLMELMTAVAAVGDAVVGFCTMRGISVHRAELLFLYIHSGYRGRGLGTQLVHHAEMGIQRTHPHLRRIYLDTAVPAYNQAFWEQMGYHPTGTSHCEYPTGRIPATRLEKRLPGNEEGVDPGYDRGSGWEGKP